MNNKVTLIDAVFMIMRGLELPDSGSHYHKYYRSLLNEINQGRILIMKRDGRDWVEEAAINSYIKELIIKREKEKEKEVRAFYFDENGQFQINEKSLSSEVFSTEAEKAIISIQALVTYYKSGECSIEQAVEEIAKIVGFE
ncbi:hypothetical protein F9802_18260 [Bacillus aerolatus]|uniref:Uncharacterized protein n=1 Tax=Bacillus aerolatus TaxID=2653354 RepID=A0A6I1FB00_9BACI|nr:hypothetical protein [Bacillus aerolatus]KAB7704235.1 hypothetical protein F9802_18260 [Bacillus aerolatus]